MIADRVAAVRERIARAAGRASRAPDEIILVAVSKTFPAEAVRRAFAAGVRHFGENRIQEAEVKVAELSQLREEGLQWHFIGHLQSNKARKAQGLFDVIETIDSLDLAGRLSRAASERGKTLPVLLQVDLAGEERKFGVSGGSALSVLEGIRRLDRLRVEGLMTLPPYLDSEDVRPYFRRLAALRDQATAAGLLQGGELSMGMSHDFETAIEEGATIVRVGSAIFGQRTAAA